MDEIRGRFSDVRYREHAVIRLHEHRITIQEVREAVESESAELIESGLSRYGAVCLALGWLADGRPLHILFGTGDILWVLTAYDPSADPEQRFERPEYRLRRRSDSERGGSHG